MSFGLEAYVCGCLVGACVAIACIEDRPKRLGEADKFVYFKALEVAKQIDE